MAGYYQNCNCCGHEFSNPSGARAYLRHLAASTYYGCRMSPEATYWLAAKAREFLNIDTFAVYVSMFYEGWKPSGPDIIPCAYGWVSFAGEPKAPEYQAWRARVGLAPCSQVKWPHVCGAGHETPL